MKKLTLALSCFFVLISKQVMAIELFGTASNMVVIKTSDSNTTIYVKNYRDQLVELYKADFVYTGGNGAAVDQYDDILFVVFACGRQNETCVRFFNRKNNALSRIYNNFVAANTNAGKQLVVDYNVSKGILNLDTMFELCKKSAVYPLRINPSSIFGANMDFLPNGDLLIEYAAPGTGNHVTKILKINYQQIFNSCKNG